MECMTRSQDWRHGVHTPLLPATTQLNRALMAAGGCQFSWVQVRAARSDWCRQEAPAGVAEPRRCHLVVTRRITGLARSMRCKTVLR